MAEDDVPTFGDLVRQSRLAAGLTQQELAERAGLSVRGISDLERGLVRAPRRDTLTLLAEGLALPDIEQQRWEELRQRHAVLRASSRSSDDNLGQSGGRLPHPLTSFVGRERDQAEMIALLGRPEVRLLTITGPGGVGKTRLAIALAHRLRGTYRDGVAFIDLVPVREPERVLAAIAATLGVRIAGVQSPLDALTTQLRGARRLLVLDNVEHVAESAPDIAELLTVCPEITILATGRGPLHLQGEWEYSLSPLDLPEDSEHTDPATLGEVEAVALFTQRAQAVQPGFRITADNARAVAAICRRLDGLPLAIELATARIRLLPPEAMLERLEWCLPLLVSRDRDVPERHRTLRATIQWSYDLLSSAEQHLYRVLSVFQGGWTLEAAEAMFAGDEFTVLNKLEQLIDQSFVYVDERSDGTARYGMLETIREFGLEQLQALGEVDTARCRHTSHVLALVEQAESYFWGADQALWMARLELEHANLRAALRWTGERAQHGDMQATVWSLQLAGAAWWFWYVHGHAREAQDHLAAAVQRFRDRQEGGRALADSVDVALAYAECLLGLASAAVWMADYERFETLIRECQAIYRRWGKGRDMALSLIFMGYAAQHAGDFAEAEALLEEGITAFRELRDPGSVALGLLGMGEMRLRQLRYDEAAEILAESLALFEPIEDTRGLAAAQATLGAVRLGQGNPAAARERLLESLRARQTIGDKGGIAWCLERLAQLALVETAPPDIPAMRATRLLAAAKALRDTIGSPVDPVDQPMIERLIRDAQRQLSETAFIAAWEAGRVMTLDEVLAYAFGEHVTEGETSAAGTGSGLSRREIEVLKLLVEGYTNQQIADTLFISHHTVARHVAHILNKLGVESRTAAATWAMRQGIG